MSMIVDLRARAADAGVAALYFDEVPETARLPYALGTVVSDPRPEHLQGYMGMRQTRIQIDCYALSGKAAFDMAEALIAALSDPGTVGDTKFGRCKAQGPVDMTAQDGGGKTVHRKMIEFSVAHRAI